MLEKQTTEKGNGLHLSGVAVHFLTYFEVLWFT